MQAAEFQEVPGEAEADAVRDAFLKGAGPEPEGIAAALAGANGASRARAIGRLQRERGNAFVQRVVAESRGEPGRMVGLSQPDMVQEVHQRQDGGSPLAEGARAQMEGYFGADLSDVRVHAGGEAVEPQPRAGRQRLHRRAGHLLRRRACTTPPAATARPPWPTS